MATDRTFSRSDRLRAIAQAEIQQEEDRREIERLKIQVRQSRQTILARIIYVLRYMKPTIKWEYRK